MLKYWGYIFKLHSQTNIGSSSNNIFFSAYHSKPLYVSIMSSLYMQSAYFLNALNVAIMQNIWTHITANNNNNVLLIHLRHKELQWIYIFTVNSLYEMFKWGHMAQLQTTFSFWRTTPNLFISTLWCSLYSYYVYFLSAFGGWVTPLVISYFTTPVLIFILIYLV